MGIKAGCLFSEMTEEKMCSESVAAEIYALYPRKVGRRRAIAEIQKALRRLERGENNGELIAIEDAVERLKKRVELFANSDAGNRGSFTPHPSTWFCQSRYLDDPTEWRDPEEERKRANF